MFGSMKRYKNKGHGKAMTEATRSRGFTLIEMLVVIGIISVLMAALTVGMGHIAKTAQKTKAQEAVSNAATALGIIFQKEMNWPKLLTQNFKKGGFGRLDERVSRVFVTHGLLGLAYDKSKKSSSGVIELVGTDRCGVVTPWAVDVLKRSTGDGKSLSVPSGGTVEDHVLYYALDDDGDGFTEASVGGTTVKVRASAIVWCAGADGKLGVYGKHSKESSDDIYSWARQQNASLK